MRNSVPGWQRIGVRVRLGMLLASLLLAPGVAQADSSGFQGDFREAFWTNSPTGQGNVYFTNSDTELVLEGPNQPAVQQTSLEGIVYGGPLGGGLVVGGTVEFHWEYNSGDALSTSEADFAWLAPGDSDPTVVVLGQGGPGVLMSGPFTTPLLTAGTTFQFLLSTDTPANKLSGTLVITDFVFREVPEPATVTLLAAGLLPLGAAAWRRSRRQVSAGA